MARVALGYRGRPAAPGPALLAVRSTAPVAAPPLVALLLGASACSAPGGDLRVDLRADVDRDGVVAPPGGADDAGEDGWTAARGATVLANLDDDQGVCASDSTIPDPALDDCSDAADEVVNGEADLADLAPLFVSPWPDAPRGARGFVSVRPAERGRIFRLDGAEPVALDERDPLDRDALRDGIELGLEATDVVRDPTVWDGSLQVRLHVEAEGAAGDDRVAFRVAPIVVNHHLQAPAAVLAADLPGLGEVAYRDDLTDAVVASGAAAGLTLVTARANDQWSQDHYEAGWTSVPGPAGPHGMTVFLRSPHVDYFTDPLFPLRRAGRAVFEDFRGPDVAGVQEYEPGGTEEQQTLNSLGNLEVVPPYSHGGVDYPFGRLLIGMTDALAPDARFLELLRAQGVQPWIVLDTSWLTVGHVDETLSFVGVDSPRGWAVVVADVGLTLELFTGWAAAGHGEAELFVDKEWLDLEDLASFPATTTVQGVLDDPEVMAASAVAEVETAGQLAVLERETGLEEADLIRVPSLHYRTLGGSVAYLPATANLAELGRGHVAVADPHGPVIDGEDALRAAIVAAFAPRGITVHFVEDWDGYHRLNGDVHCGSNVVRARPAEEDWWTATD